VREKQTFDLINHEANNVLKCNTIESSVNTVSFEEVNLSDCVTIISALTLDWTEFNKL